MCLLVDEKLTEEVRARGTITAWKVLKRYPDGLWSPWNLGFIWHPEWNSTGEQGPHITFASDQYGDEVKYLGRGVLHVFLNEDDAIKDAAMYGTGQAVAVPVRCETEDLVAAGAWSVNHAKKTAGYRRVWIDPEDYQRALNGERTDPPAQEAKCPAG